MYFDQRDGWSERIRYALQAVAYPIQVAVGSPRQAVDCHRRVVRDPRRPSRARTRRCGSSVRELTLRAPDLRGDGAGERAAARADRGRCPRWYRRACSPTWSARTSPAAGSAWSSTRVTAAACTARRPWWMPPALSARWCASGPWSAEVMLISDVDAAVPVQIVRSGKRSIVVGTGDSRELKMDSCRPRRT